MPMVVAMVGELTMNKELARLPRTGGYKLQANSIPSIVKMRKKLFGSFQTIQTHMVCFVELGVWKHT